MKKTLLATALLLTSTASLALPSGHWAGSGEWSTTDNQSAPFQYDLKVVGEQLTGSWTFDGHAVPFRMRLVENGKFFQVFSGENQVGQGYCYGVQCHYSAVIPNQGEVEETLTFKDNDLYALGSKTFQDKKTIWAADLKTQAP